MPSKPLRIFGILFILSAIVFMVLNLKRVADAKTFWIAIPLLVLGLIFVTRGRKG